MNSFYKDFFLFFGKSINNFYPKNFDYKIRKLGFRRKAMLFFELFINALSYGNPFVETDKRYVIISVISDSNSIIVSNKTGKPIKSNTKFQSISKKIEFDPKLLGHGGLLYIHNFLEQTNVGNLKIFLDDDKDIFNVILRFNGYKNIQA